MIKAIIFDCFGVVISDALSVLAAGLEEREPAKVADMRALVHAANRGIIDPGESTARIAGLLGMTVEQYRQAISSGEVRDQQLLDYIKRLRTDYKTGMLSNITQQGIERRFPHDELAEYFDEIVISSVIGYAKPDPEAYQAVCDRLGVAPMECVFTDDRPDYCSAAADVGLWAIVYQNLAQFRHDLAEVLRTA